jgi:hypothetical protein
VLGTYQGIGPSSPFITQMLHMLLRTQELVMRWTRFKKTNIKRTHKNKKRELLHPGPAFETDPGGEISQLPVNYFDVFNQHLLFENNLSMHVCRERSLCNANFS